MRKKASILIQNFIFDIFKAFQKVLNWPEKLVAQGFFYNGHIPGDRAGRARGEGSLPIGLRRQDHSCFKNVREWLRMSKKERKKRRGDNNDDNLGGGLERRKEMMWAQ